MKSVTVALTASDLAKLQRGVTAQGGLQSLIRRLQNGIRIKAGHAWLTIGDADLVRIVPYWRQTGGKAGAGGYQRRLPVESLRPYLQSAVPMFWDERPAKEAVSYCYFKREGLIGEPTRIKIGRGTEKRARTGKSTDNPRMLVTLARVVEEPGADERAYHAMFARLRIDPSQEWFWPGDDLMALIKQLADAAMPPSLFPTKQTPSL